MTHPPNLISVNNLHIKIVKEENREDKTQSSESQSIKRVYTAYTRSRGIRLRTLAKKEHCSTFYN